VHTQTSEEKVSDIVKKTVCDIESATISIIIADRTNRFCDLVIGLY
jgi:hypothetical protein